MDLQSHPQAIFEGNLNSLSHYVNRIWANYFSFLTNSKWTSYVNSGWVPTHSVLTVFSQLLEAHTDWFSFLLSGTKIRCFTYPQENESKDLICKYCKPKISFKTWSVYLLIHAAALNCVEISSSPMENCPLYLAYVKGTLQPI